MAKKFKFKLEPVLKVRKILKDMQEAKLAKANKAYNETLEYINSLDQRQEQVYESMLENASQDFSLIDHQNQEAFNAMIISEKAKEKTRLAKREKAKIFEQKRYIDFAKGSKIIEKLKDKALELHQKELLITENKQIDDLVNSRYRVYGN